MESSATKALYIGAYIFVFVSALTVTLFLFNSILDFSNLAYEFETSNVSNQILINVPVEAKRLLSSDEVASYYYNYIKSDVYVNNTNDTNIYIVQICDSNNNVIFDTSDTNKNANENKSYKEIINKLGKDNKYILSYKKVDSNGKVVIELRKATQEEIDAIQ